MDGQQEQVEREFEVAIAEASGLVGQELDRSRQIWNSDAGADSVRQFCWGMGDDNPLYLDEEYALGSVLAARTAPPTYLYTIDTSSIFPGLPGWPALLAGQRWRWFQRTRVGETYTARARYTDCREKRRGDGGRMILQTGEVDYLDAAGEPVAWTSGVTARFQPKPGARLRHEPREHSYSDEELHEIERATMAEKPRGADPRAWDSVAVGEEVGPLTKGPLTMTDMLCWYAGGGVHGRRPHRLMWQEARRTSENFTSQGGTRSHVGVGHFDTAKAREMGMPGAYDNGNQRTSWVAQLLTDWMGDGGFLKELDVRIKTPKVIGDTTRFAGVVAAREVDGDGDHVVTVQITGTNQADQVNTTATAVVRLPHTP